ncbi:hypothetical protein ACP275_11G136700 [Erythranthe tilingii]
MVQGPRAKSRKSPSVQLDYTVHIQEVKPWPPSVSLRTIRSVLIQWEHGDKKSGSTNQVVPSIDDGTIEFSESFRLSLTLIREVTIKGDGFQKNCIEFNLYEPRMDKTVKGQLLGTAVVDLAEHGVIRESLCISAPISCKRAYRNTAQPLLFLKIEPFERSRTSSSSRESLMRETSMDRSNFESVSALSEECAEEAEVASFTTDDDASSHSSLAVTSAAAESNGSSSPQTEENVTAVNGNAGKAQTNEEQVTKPRFKTEGGSSRSPSLDLSSDLAWITKRISSRSLPTSASQEMEEQQSCNKEINERKTAVEGIHVNASSPAKGDPDAGRTNSTKNYSTDKSIIEIHQTLAKEGRTVEEKEQTEDIPQSGSSKFDVQKQAVLENGLLSPPIEKVAINSNFSNIDRSKHGKSVRSSLDSSRTNNGSLRINQFIVGDTKNHTQGSVSSEYKDAKIYPKEKINLLSESKVQHLERRMEVLEAELREAAAIEVSLYSVVAEHGSSMTKVHAPARRLSRLYLHASKQNSKSRRGSAAKSIVSGLVLVSKACGNDVPRLTFWLSNSIVLRVVMSKSFGDSKLPISVGPVIGTATGTVRDRNGKKNPSPLKWESFSGKSPIQESSDDWENPLTFLTALEKVEVWIFSRIIESIWWQTFTPHMQSSNAGVNVDSDSSKLYERTSSSIDQRQVNFSLELWKKAFSDACERICPLRAGGHVCGCLPVLSRVIMEQLIARLDVAMFNAVLRESADEIPTDPVADPISDAEVLPIPPGKASFGAGAQLKNAIGNWSRWLTDQFGIDDDEILKDNLDDNEDDERLSDDTSSKSFHLLNALSDLMMLPKDLLLSRTVRKEVCPTFGPPLIRRVLNSFVPDEFCPDPIPAVVLEALNSKDPFDSEEEDGIMSFPCDAARIQYQPPSTASVANLLGEIQSHSQLTRSKSSVLKKSQTSDDELDELDSPLKSIIIDNFQASANRNGSRSSNALRYQLLRDVWMDCD